MMKNKSKLFFLGLIIFYLITFFAPNKPIYFLAYFFSTFFFYLASNNLLLSLLLSLILSLFSDIGLAASLFILEPQELNLGTGYGISPSVILLLCLLPFAIKQQIKSIKLVDIFVILFFICSIIGLIIFSSYDSVLYGIISLGEILLAYFLFRTFLTEKSLKDIVIIIVSILLFQTILGGFQLILQRPLSLLSESSTFVAPYGLTTPEDVSLYRVVGTFVHPNNFAAVLLSIMPFLFLYKTESIYLRIFKFVPVLILFFTYSRAAWFIFALIMVILFLVKEIRFRIPKEVPLYYYLIPVIFTLIFIYLTPYLNARLNTLPYAFEERSSWGIRMKLLEEGMSLVTQYPLTGVGLNRSVQVYAESPVTDIVEITGGRKFYKIHNLFLEIAAEIGIPGLIFFVGFLLLVLKRYFTEKLVYPKNAAFFGLVGLIAISMFNPFFHASQFRYFFLLAAIIFA